MLIREAQNPETWDAFLKTQRFSPFLQSWTMGEVYQELHQTPLRLEIVNDDQQIVGICQALVVSARRGRHLSIPYGPVLTDPAALPLLIESLKEHARVHRCSFIRLSPHWPLTETTNFTSSAKPSPLHLLAEHLWYLPLKTTDRWGTSNMESFDIPHSTFDIRKEMAAAQQRTEEDIFKNMRSTARNLVRRAEKDGVTITASDEPMKDIAHFIALHDETRQRHGFTPYSNAFFRTQVAKFAPRGECTLYLAHYQNEVISASIHMHVGGETSYHHGASTYRHRKIPSSYLLQWTAIRDALRRNDDIYNFWGIAPMKEDGTIQNPKHPFAGVTLFKTGFGGKLLNLMHCVDIPLSPSYHLTRSIETIRKWKRGF